MHYGDWTRVTSAHMHIILVAYVSNELLEDNERTNDGCSVDG